MGTYLRTLLASRIRRIGYRLRGLSHTEAYWAERAARLGHKADSLISNTGEDRALYRECLAQALVGVAWQPGPHRLAVDYGCGTGRFTSLLAESVGGTAIGVDPMRSMLALASPCHRVSFRPIDTGVAPVADGAADLVACIHVLGGLGRASLACVVADVQRILRPGGLLFVVEADEGHGSAHWQGRSARFYAQLWPACPLVIGRRVTQGDRRASVLWGVRG